MSENLGLNAASGPFIAGVFLLLMAALELFILVRPGLLQAGRQIDAQLTEESNQESEISAVRSLQSIFRQPMAQFAVGSMVIGQVVMVLRMVITPLYMDRLGHGTQTISLIIMAHTIGMFAFSGVTGWLIESGRS